MQAGCGETLTRAYYWNVNFKLDFGVNARTFNSSTCTNYTVKVQIREREGLGIAQLWPGKCVINLPCSQYNASVKHYNAT